MIQSETEAESHYAKLLWQFDNESTSGRYSSQVNQIRWVAIFEVPGWRLIDSMTINQV